MENPKVLAQSKTFLENRKIPGEKPQKLNVLTGDNQYRDDEEAFEDHWAENGGSAYSGKVYPKGIATEVLSAGIERLHADPALFAEEDSEYFTFVVNTLRGVVESSYGSHH